MKFQERSFVANASYRPRPKIHYNQDLELIVIATVWGKEFPIDDIISKIESYFISSQTDTELTSPFQPLNTYSKLQNEVRIALLMANDYVWREKNRTEYSAGLELFIGIKRDKQFYYTSIGHPHILLSREGKTILPLKLDLDHSLDMSEKNLMPALPSHFLGQNSSIDPDVQALTIQNHDQILLLSKSWIPEKLMHAKKSKRDFEDFHRSLSESDEQPAWFGLISFD